MKRPESLYNSPSCMGVYPHDPDLDWHAVKRLGAIGISTVVIENQSVELFWRHSKYPLEICEGLRRLALGRHMRSEYHAGIRHFFEVNAKRLLPAIEMIVAGLKGRELLPISAIGVADTDVEMWRTVFPSRELMEANLAAYGG